MGKQPPAVRRHDREVLEFGVLIQGTEMMNGGGAGHYKKGQTSRHVCDLQDKRVRQLKLNGIKARKLSQRYSVMQASYFRSQGGIQKGVVVVGDNATAIVRDSRGFRLSSPARRLRSQYSSSAERFAVSNRLPTIKACTTMPQIFSQAYSPFVLYIGLMPAGAYGVFPPFLLLLTFVRTEVCSSFI